jgi:hypothetical protein
MAPNIIQHDGDLKDRSSKGTIVLVGGFLNPTNAGESYEVLKIFCTDYVFVNQLARRFTGEKP